jgi:hypothetical protein
MRSILAIIVLVTVIGFTMTACNKSGGSSGSKSSGGGGKTLNSAEELKEYLDKQPANSPDKPIKVSMGANELMLPKIRDVLNTAGKYVSLNITGNALTKIPIYAFYNKDTGKSCETLVSVTIPNSVTSIGGTAFLSCTSLTSINIPNSVTSIGYSAFYGCTSLTSINIPNSVTGIGSSAFYGCTSLASINIPDSVTNIESDAFSMCTSLTSITIPNSVTEIEKRAFQGSGLTSVTIPKSVTSIEGWAFNGCTSLTSVTFQGTISSDNLGVYDSFYDSFYGSPFIGDLREKYLAGGIGTYTTTAPVNENSKWTKQ